MADSQGNKRIAKNTLLLFIRTAVSMCIALFSSRLVLQHLGVSDYGVYNVVGGMVAMLVALSGPLKGITYRYIAYAIGKKDSLYQSQVFSASVKIHAILAFSILLILETIGIWYINTKMNLPEGRLRAANIVFQLSTASFVINVFAMPFHSAIVAYERFKVYAYVDIFVAVCDLCIAISLAFCAWDRLIYYALMRLISHTTASGFYVFYTIFNFKDCHLERVNNKQLYKEIVSLTGWNFVGTASSTIYSQGSSLILNYFWGVLLNASMGVANQVSSAVNSFVNSFTTAINPQITKSYAEGIYSRTTELVFLGAKISTALLLLMGYPVVLNIDFLLDLWLVDVPEQSQLFVALTLLSVFLSAFNNPLNMLILSTGKIKAYQFGCFMVNVAAVVLLYFCFFMGMPVYSLFIILSLTNIIKTIILLKLSYIYVSFPVKEFIVKVYGKGILLLLVILSTITLKRNFHYQVDFVLFIVETMIAIGFISILIYIFLLNQSERVSVRKIIKNRLLSPHN